MTSAPSVTDIGFSGMRVRYRISADQPVASAIGTSGTSARRGRRNASRSTAATASRPARAEKDPRRDGEKAGDEREDPPPRRGDLVVRLGREHGQSGEPGLHAGG